MTYRRTHDHLYDIFTAPEAPEGDGPAVDELADAIAAAVSAAISAAICLACGEAYTLDGCPCGGVEATTTAP